MMRRTSYKWIGWLFSAIIFIFLLSGCDQKKPTQVRPPVPVNVFKVHLSDVPVILSYIGLTQAINTVDLRARVKGFLEKQNFVEGSYVKKGELMYVIDKRQYIADLLQAKAALAQAKADAVFKDKTAARKIKLVRTGAISKEDYDQADSAAKAANAKVKQEEANVAQAKLNLSYCTIVSPIDGKVGETFVDVGNLVGGTTDTKLATVIQLDPIYIAINPSVKDNAYIMSYLRNHAIKVTANLPENPDFVFTGYLDFVNNQAEQQTSTVFLRATMKNREHALLPNVYVQTQIHVTTIKNALSIPTKSILEGQDEQYVFVIKDGKADPVEVETGRVVADKTVITKGLKIGDEVIINNFQKLRPGAAVKVVPESATKKNPKEAN